MGPGQNPAGLMPPSHGTSYFRPWELSSHWHFDLHFMRLVHLAYSHLKLFSWTAAAGVVWRACVAQEVSWTCRPTVMKAGMPGVVMDTRAEGGGNQRNPKKWDHRGEFVGTEALVPHPPPLQGLVVSVKYHYGPLPLPLIPPSYKDLIHTHCCHPLTHRHRCLNICNVPITHQLGRLCNVSLNTGPAPCSGSTFPTADIIV